MNMVKTPKQIDEAIGVFAGALTPVNAGKFLKMDRGIQERIIYAAFEKGIIAYKFGRKYEKLH